MTLILTNLPPASAVTLARFAQVSQSFAAEGGVVETALRSRHGPQPAALPDAFDTWLAKLLWDERRSGVHAPVLSVGRTHGATVHDGRCFVWGSEYVSYDGREVPGLLGVGLRNQARHVYQGNVDTPKPLANVTNAVSVSCGREHTLVLAADGSVYAFGNGEWGQCGSAKGRPKTDFFPPFAQPERLRGAHTLSQPSTFGQLKDAYWKIDTLYFIDENDLPFASCAECIGCDNPPMQISGSKMQDNYEPERGGHPYGPFGMVPPVFVVPVPRRVSWASPKVLKVSAGELHSLLLCEDGHVYAFGNAHEGRLGLGPSSPPKHMTEPARLELGALAGVRVVDISAGSDHSLAVRADGRVAAWGSRHAILGGAPPPRPAESTGLPALVDETPELIHLASAGNKHSLLVGRDGGVYSFGHGYGGCLGHGADESDKFAPTKIEALSGVAVRVVAAGETHSLVMDGDGHVYEWGYEDTNSIDWSDEEDVEETPLHVRGEPVLLSERSHKFYDSFGRRSDPGADGDEKKKPVFNEPDLCATAIAAGWGMTAVRSATGLGSSGGGWTDCGVGFESSAWPGDEEATMVAAVKEEDEEEHEPQQAGCVIS